MLAPTNEYLADLAWETYLNEERNVTMDHEERPVLLAFAGEAGASCMVSAAATPITCMTCMLLAGTCGHRHHTV